jgi:UDP-N-acetyl-D-mannosaminuronate dehydrogenase
MPARDLFQKINQHSAVIGILGMGYVGLLLMLRFSKVGYHVIGIDIDRSKVEAPNAGRSHTTAAARSYWASLARNMSTMICASRPRWT